MKFIRIIVACVILSVSLNAQRADNTALSSDSKIEINFRDLDVTDFVRLVSNILNKNILLQEAIAGKVEFVSATPVDKRDLPNILQSVLASKGYAIVDHGAYMEVVRSNLASQYNLPIENKSAKNYGQMITQAINVKGLNVDEVINKIRHLASISARFATVRENNRLIITDFARNIETIKRVIEVMEQNVASEVAFIKMRNANIEQIFPVLQSITRSVFSEKIESERVTLYENKADNGVIAVGSVENIKRLKDIVANLDKGQESLQMVTKVIQLNNTEAKDIHKVVSELLSSNSLNTIVQTGTQTVGNQTVLQTAAKSTDVNKPILSLDEASNSIIVLATQKDYEIIKSIVKELDKEQKQVFVKAKIVEISDVASRRIGVKYGLEGGKATSDGLYTFAMNMGGSALTLSSALSSALTFGDIRSGLAFGASIDFLKTNGAANIVSEPSVLCINNIESKIYVGQTQSIITSATNSDSTTDLTRNTYTREDIGLTLQVKPRIANDGKVTLQIEAIVEDVIDGSGGDSGMPTTTKREVTTRAIVKHGESVIVGGLIRNKDSKNKDKVPLLGDIPLLGRLFTHSTDINDQMNIVIVLTPYIINSSDELSQLRTQLSELDQLQEAYSRRLQEELQKKIENAPKAKESKKIAIKEDVDSAGSENKVSLAVKEDISTVVKEEKVNAVKEDKSDVVKENKISVDKSNFKFGSDEYWDAIMRSENGS
ncbi:MAG: type II secretion system secretin GspD [Campylobacteraceae bacterium]|jgi:general secretion pathway protein D|nr:type II secretion system secretin GspD [Campylobacteraceae bacterium]